MGSHISSLERLHARLSDRARTAPRSGATYLVPGPWLGAGPACQAVDPWQLYLERVGEILSVPFPPPRAGRGRGWSRRAVVYNLLVRAATAFDHDGDGEVSAEPTDEGWRETGTFLKSIALLPLLRGLGFNTLHVLPVTAVGRHGRKGNLGSIYAVQNPYRLDPMLAEPAVGLGPEVEFAAFVEAAHRLGMRVVVEFALRTASLDADWVKDHPEWFYWIRADVPDRSPGDTRPDAYGAPLFSSEELERIRRKVEQGDLEGLPAPPAAYRSMFVPPPPRGSVRKEGEAWIGTLPDGTQARIPGAFADWPPDDPQPPWTDVTYLRIYDHPDFNYIAYNTVRMYDRRLARPENAVWSLWEQIAGVLPFYAERFGIDGAMVDMGHAFPADLKRRIVEDARQVDPDFAFWGEAFTYDGQLAEEGYDAVVGNYWWLVWRPSRLIEDLLRPLAVQGLPLPFLAAPETHNTPRAAAREGGLQAARMAWTLGCFLPGIPFCHSGFELGETLPVNTGLDFAPEDLARYPADILPLFSTAAYRWENPVNLLAWIRQVLSIRGRFADLVADPTPSTLDLIASDQPEVWAVIRRRRGRGLALVVNLNRTEPRDFAIRLPVEASEVTDLLSGKTLRVEEGWLRARWPPAGCALFEIGQSK